MRKLMVICLVLGLALGAAAATIHQAAIEGNLDQVKALLEGNPDLLNAKDSEGKTALHQAVYNGQEDVAEYLIDRGADLNARSNQNSVPLNGAAFYGHNNAVKLLIDRGADINAANNAGYTPLLSGTAAGHFEIVKMLIAAGADKNARLNLDNANALLVAGFSGNNVLIEYFLSQGFDINSTNNENEGLLHYAAFGTNIELIERLINNGVDVNAKSTKNVVPLHYAALGCQLEVVTYLLNSGADVNIADDEGETPLHEAMIGAFRDTTNSAIEIVKLLVEHGADINKQTTQGTTPIFWAIYGDKPDLMEYLLSVGADINLSNSNGLSPLHESITRGKAEYVVMLVQNGARNDIKDTHYGFTPLHQAALNGNIEIVKAVLPCVKDINVKDNEGHTPVYYAAKYGHKSVAELLKAKGAKEKGLEENYGYSQYLVKDVKDKEAVLWYLGHCGWGIKTKNHFLIFDYWEREANVTQPGLANGHILPDELKGQNVKLFVSHEHQDHYDSGIFKWQESLKNLTYIFGFHPEDLPEDARMNYNGQKYEYIEPHETRIIDGVEITPIRANDAGEGFLVKVDGLNIYHAGDHAGWLEGQRDGFTGEIDFLAGKTKSVDFAFVNVTGCHVQDTVALAEGTFYTIDKLAPKVIVPTHGIDREYVYKEYAEKIHAKNPELEVLCPDRRGDRFMYKDDQIM